MGMDGYRLQIILFDLIRERINDPKNWIDEISEVLNLSKSAVYKKINATSSLSLEELSILLVRYDISFDAGASWDVMELPRSLALVSWFVRRASCSRALGSAIR